MRKSYLFLSILLILSPFLLGCDAGDPGERFERKSEWAAQSFDVPLMTQHELLETLEKDSVLLVDTRTEEEFEVSHLPGALNWSDYRDSSPPDSLINHLVEGGKVVFYCSIGYRSGEALERASEATNTTENLYNLRGGIFQWANEGRALEGGEMVHGYDDDWGQLLSPEKLYK